MSQSYGRANEELLREVVEGSLRRPPDRPHRRALSAPLISCRADGGSSGHSEPVGAAGQGAFLWPF
jgi:hypothetical protein